MGLKNSSDIIGGVDLKLNKVYKNDLIGSDGWNNWKDLFEVLNATCNYVVLRGFEELPRNNSEKDLDLLTDDYQRLASIIGMIQVKSKPYKGFIVVDGQKVSVDIRFIGDHYFDTKFQAKVLKDRIIKNDVYVPNDDDYFFSLLYHCKVHKNKVKPIYFSVLDNLALRLGLDWFDITKSLNDTNSSKILNGYYRAHGFVYENPIDNDVFANEKIIKHLTSHKKNSINLKNKLRKITPPFLLLLRRKILNIF